MLPDSYEWNGLPTQEELVRIRVEQRSVFCGGCSRDFKTLLLVAKQLPDYSFTVIAAKKIWREEWEIPDNVKVFFDTSKDFFYTSLFKSAILYLPLERDEANGLIVLTKAALLRRPIIVTDTSCTRNYIVNNQNGILVPMWGVSDAVKAIKKVEDESLRDRLVQKMSVDIETHSPLNYCRRILDI